MRKPSLYIILMLLLMGCNSGSPDRAYPSDRPYPNDHGVPIQKTISGTIPTPLLSTGTIVGRILNTNQRTPMAGLQIYLANLLPLTPGPGHLITIDLNATPNTSLDENGRFIFPNITPGSYALGFWTPHGTYFVMDPKDPSKELIVTVSENQIIDIGTATAAIP